jgi:hypothetical protein
MEYGISQNHPPENDGVVILLRIVRYWKKTDLPIEHKLLLLLQLQDALFNRVLDHKPHASVIPQLNDMPNQRRVGQWVGLFRENYNGSAAAHLIGLNCPIRWIRSCAWLSTAGFHQGSIKKTYAARNANNQA